MSKLAEIVMENVGKSSFDMRCFFQGMVDKGELEAYLVRINEEIVKKDDKKERIVIIKKGATLVPTKEIQENRNIFVKDSKTGIFYNLNIGSQGGAFYDDGDSQTIYHNCILEKLTKSFDRKNIDFNSYAGLVIPEEIIEARLRVNHSDDWNSSGETDYIGVSHGNFTIEGEKDSLFEKVYEFVRK